MDKVFYNEASASKLGWKPQWFIPGHDQFDNKLINAIRAYQRAHGMKADGMCGPGTYRRIQADQDMLRDHVFQKVKSGAKFIYYMGQPFPIDWDNVSTYNDDNCLKLTGAMRRQSKKRNIKYFVNHWDVCLNSESCVRVLNKRNISIHFCIDNDGCIHQLADCNDICFHAGSSTSNAASIGVEISNAYYPKYQGWYEKNGFGKRPIIDNATVHGKSMKPFTGFYDVQLEAAKALWSAIHNAVGIPLVGPNSKDTVDKDLQKGKFKGFCSHYHITSRKIDCAGLDIWSMIEDIKNK